MSDKNILYGVIIVLVVLLILSTRKNPMSLFKTPSTSKTESSNTAITQPLPTSSTSQTQEVLAKSREQMPSKAANQTRLRTLNQMFGGIPIGPKDFPLGPLGPDEKTILPVNPPRRVVLKGPLGYVSASPSGIIKGNMDTIGEWEKFTIISSKQVAGTVNIRSHHGKYLSADFEGNVSAGVDIPGAWEDWWLESMGGMMMSMKSFHYKYLSVKPNGCVMADRSIPLSWEIFEVVDID